MSKPRLGAGLALMSTGLFGSFISGLRGWFGDYIRLASRGDIIDRVVGRYLIPGSLLLGGWVIGSDAVVFIRQQLKQELGKHQEQSYVQKKLADQYLATGIAPQNDLVGGDVAGEDESVDPYDDGSGEVENKAELLHDCFLPNTD